MVISARSTFSSTTQPRKMHMSMPPMGMMSLATRKSKRSKKFKPKTFTSDQSPNDHEQKVPKTFLSQAILNNMEFNKVDAQGFHLNASVCMPYDASCYLVETLVSFDGKLTTKVLEY